MVRIILFALFFYLIYFFIKFLLVKPFRDGYRQGKRPGKRSWDSTFRSRREGDVTITYDPRTTSSSGSKKVGEYVDFEEIDK